LCPSSETENLLEIDQKWIDAGWQEAESSAFFQNNGPVLRRPKSGRWRYALPGNNRHLNIAGRVHGGMVMAFADYVLGMAAYESLGMLPSITVSLNVNLTGAARIGDLIEGEAEVVRHAREIVFMRGHLVSNAKIIATAEGVWKLIGKNAKAVPHPARPRDGPALRRF
jgi:uncharacterized protein (TIGR00369 family)